LDTAARAALRPLYYYSPNSSRAAQIWWHGRPARAHGQDGRATLGCGSAALWLDPSSLRSTISVPRETMAPASGFFRLTAAERCAGAVPLSIKIKKFDGGDP